VETRCDQRGVSAPALERHRFVVSVLPYGSLAHFKSFVGRMISAIRPQTFNSIRIGNSTLLGLVGNATFAARPSRRRVGQDRQTDKAVVVQPPTVPEYVESPGAPEYEAVRGCASTTANTGN
jgi:hypothetical protein